MSHRKRYVLEGEWSGYRSSQQQIVHRSVETHFIDTLRKIKSIRYTDGTTLTLSLRECKPREVIQEKHGYTELISDAIHVVYTGRHPGGYMTVADTNLK